MDAGRQRELASEGGRAAHEKGAAHEFTPAEAREAGRKGGITVSRDHEHMATIGHKGGQAVSHDREHMAAIGRKGGEAVSRDSEHMAAIGRKRAVVNPDKGLPEALLKPEREPPASSHPQDS